MADPETNVIPSDSGSSGASDSTPQGGTPQVAQPATPIDVAEDTLLRIKGQKDPIKFGDLSKRQQADYTRKTQQHQAQVAKERQGLAAERSRLEQVAAALASRQQGGQGNQSPTDPFLTELGGAEYIDGKTAVKMIRAIQEQGFTPLVSAIKERDQVITQMYQHLVQLSNTVKELGGRAGSSDFDGKINQWLADGGYPPEAADFAKELYLAYEGDDLDAEFPAIFEARWKQIQGLFDAQRQAKVDAARRSLLVPGRGGNGAASRPIGLKGHESAKETADMLWDAMQARSGT